LQDGESTTNIFMSFAIETVEFNKVEHVKVQYKLNIVAQK